MDTNQDLPAEEAETTTFEPMEPIEAPQVIENPEPPVDPAAPEAPAAPVEAKDEAKEPFWYRKTLREKEAENARLRRELEQRQQQAQAPLPEYTDDADYPQAVTQHVQALLYQNKVETSEIMARNKFGDAAWEETNDWLLTRPDVAQWAAGQRDPCSAAIQLYQKEKLAAEIGDNPDQWREKERERLRAEILAESQPQPSGLQAPRPNLPRPGSQARSASPNQGWSGPKPISSALKNNF